ncbi:MAG: T9SS type A sorting domain-containing protein, partial [Bacteroidales bacterium]|nr:T9SS type A sorting domain-containing protein [Bacteroidales bacterium]
VAVISASGNIEGKTVTVRDEDDNTFYPEYNDDNDAATVHLNYLSTGTYTYKVYENDVYKTEFTVKVNSLPRAYIECPDNPVVGDTWNPNTAMQEGMTYHWWSDNISSLDGTTSCCPTVTFTEAGTFSATLVVKNNETGCLSEGATCTFDVGDKPQQYFLNCPDGDLSIKNEDYLMYVSAGDTEGKTLTWSTSDEEIVTLAPDTENGQCVVNFKQIGTAQINCQIAEATGEVLETVACTLNIVQPQYVEFSQHTIEVEKGDNTIVCLTAEGIDLSQATITFGSSNDEAFVVAPSDGLTGCAVVSGLEITEYTEQLTATVQYNEGSETKTFEASADVHVVEPFVCEGTKIVGGEFRDLPYANIEIGDKFRFKWIGTSNFTGMLHVQIWDLAVDTQTPETIIVSQSVAHQVYKGETYTFDDILEIQTVSESQSHNYKLYFSPMPMDCPTGYDENGDAVCYGVMCEQYYAIGKEETQECQQVAFEYSAVDNNYIHSADGLAYEAEDGDKFNVSWTATSDFSGTINLALIDKSAGANYWQEVSSWASVKVTAGVPFSVDEVFTIEGMVSTSPEIALFATVNDQVDGASFCMTNFRFHKLGDIVQECTTLELDGENSVQLQYVYNSDKIAVGDTYNYEVFGTAQFTGDLFFSLVDQSEEVGYWDMLADSKVFSVVEGERFEIKGAFTVTKEPTSTSPEVYFTVGRIDANQSGEIKTICVLSSAIYKSNGGDECYNKIVVDGGNSAVLNRVSNYQVSVGEVYEYYVSGVADFTGEAMVSFADASKDADYYFALAEPVTFAVTEGESFSQRGTFVVKNQTPSEYPDFTLMIAKNNGVTGESSSFCIDGAYIEKQVQSYTMSESEVNMFVGGTKYIYLLGDGQPYSGYVEWGVTDLSGSTTPCVTVDDGEIIANSEGQAQIYAKVHDQVVATAIVTITSFSCDGGELYTTSNNNDTPYIIYPLSNITTGDSYNVTINGKTDYDGVLATAVVDFSSVSEDDGPAQGSNLGEIMVKAGQEFSYNTILTVVSTDASAPEYKMILLLGGSEELDEFNLCATQFSVEKFTAQYTIDGIYDSYMFVGETKQLTIKNIDGTVYGGNAQWISTDENVVAIGNDGYVYAKSEGVAEVQVIIGGDIAATTLINVERATGISIGLDKPGYEIANVGDEQIVYINAIGLQAATFTYQYDESIIEVTPIQGTNSLRVKGLKVGSTHLFVTATLNGESYEAGAVVEVGGGSTSNDYTLAFAQSKYEITEGESMRACLTIGEGFKHFNPQFNFDQTVISISNPIDGSDCGVITGLKAGQTFVEVIAEAPDGKFYSAQTEVIVNAKYTQDDYKLSFEQETYEVYEGETIETCLIIGRAFEHGFQPTMSYDETIITVNEPTAAQSENCGSVTGVKEGTSLITLDVEKDGTHYTAKTHIVVLKKNVELPQMAAPVVTTEMVTLCYSKTAVSDNMTTLDEYVEKSSTDARLKWYDAAGNALTTAPIIDPKTVGKRIYYVSQIASGYNESEKVALAVNIVYVAAPELNIYEQKVCDGTQTQAFVAKSQNNEIYWYQGEGNPVAQNTNTFMPTETGTYQVRAIDVANGCVSDFATINYAVGHKIAPNFQIEKYKYALDETVELAVAPVDEEKYSVVWTIDSVVSQGITATVAFAEEGTYMIPCTIVEKESGCFASDTVVITVEKTHIPVSTIAVQPSSIEMYEGEQSYLALTFTPAFATDKNYVIEVADTAIADVVGLTVFGLKEGETTATISSTSNSSASASITITVKKFIAAREISLPTVITMSPEETKTISAAVLPTNASYNEVFFNEKEDNVIRLSANGELTALAEGTSIITAYTKGGLKASSVVVVTSSVAAITDIQVPERIEMKVGDSVSVSYKVVPATSLISQLNWSIEDEEMISFDNGVVKAVKAGSTTLTVSFANIEKSIAIVVNESDAPVVITTPNVSATQGDDIKVDLTDVISDDNTAVEDLTVTTLSENFNVSVNNGVLTVTPKDNSFVGVDTVTVVVTDENNLSVELPVVVEITEIQNQAPEILMDTIMIKYNACNYIQLSELVSDDFTPYNKMKYSFTSNVKASVMLRKQLRLFTDNPDLESDILTMTVTDADGVSTTKDILLLLTALPNKAPKIAEIPTQNENDSTKFGTIDLAQYVKDDYTSSSAIAWTAADVENIAVTISEGKATVKVLNEFWNGAAAVTFYAKDEEGLTDSTVVYYVRNVTIKKEEPSTEPSSTVVATWEGAPAFDFMTMKTIGVPGSQFILMASCSGYECTWSWDIPKANGVDPTSLMQFITFDKPGTYDVTFTVQSPDGNFQKSITKENFLTVVGINERTPAICKGDAAILTATEGLDSYYWSTGDAKNTTTDRPETTTLYQLTMKKGMFTLIDTVTVKVSVPVALMEDSVMCKGTTFDLEAQGEYVSYTWNTGESTKAIALPDVVASYSVMAVDDMQCVSVDTFNLTTVNELPIINLGPDQTPCDGTTVTLDAGEGYEYLWSNSSTEQTITLSQGTDTVWARIIDNNLCVNYDTVVVAFTYPYPEQLGVATASETTDHVILAWEKTAGVNTQSYVIERETYETDRWDPVGDTVKFSQPGLVVDEWVNSKQTAYKYRLVTIDGCGNKAISEVHRTMHSMRVQDPETGLMQLHWTGYEPIRQQDGSATIKQYIILRGTEGNMDSVGFIPASSDEYIWTETDASMTDLKTIKYRVAFRLNHPVNENAVNTLDGQPVEGFYTKAESGPFSLALSNIAELETLAVDEVPFADVIVYPTTFSSFINVAISADIETNFMIEVVNANGQVVTRAQTGEISKTLLQIPADNFKQGIYTVKISDGQQVKTIKVVK